MENKIKCYNKDCNPQLPISDENWCAICGGTGFIYAPVQKDAINFAEWILKNATPETRQGQDGWNYFRRSKYMNTKQLYDTFKNQG